MHCMRRLTFYTAPVSVSVLLPVLIWQEVRMPHTGLGSTACGSSVLYGVHIKEVSNTHSVFI